MSHHGINPLDDPARRAMLEQVTGALKDEQRNLRGEFPHGRLNKDDEGAMACAIGPENGKIVMRFASPVAWIGFTPDQAMQIALLLIEHARATGLTKPVTIGL